jgi:hypothetical protein
MTNPQQGPDTVRKHTVLSPPRLEKGRTPPGYRVLHVIVPDRLFNNLKARAYLTGTRFPEYIARLLEETGPVTDFRTPQAAMAPQAPMPATTV